MDGLETDGDAFRRRIEALSALPQRLAAPDEPGAMYDDIDAELAGAARTTAWSRACPSRFVMARLDDVDERTRERVRDWVANPRGRTLIATGPVGSGKTHLAAAAGRERYMAGDTVWFAPIVELFDALRPGGPAGALQRAQAVDLLIVDDLGAEKLTEWAMERLYLIVNRRWLDERATIVTTNVAPKELGVEVGERIMSRLSHDAVKVGLLGADRRR